MSKYTKGKLHRHGLEIHIERSESGKIVEHTCIANMNDTMNLPIVSNANHLLKCWNSHDALLAALSPFVSFKLFLDAIRETQKQKPLTTHDCIASVMGSGASDYIWYGDLEKAEQALSAAKEE